MIGFEDLIFIIYIWVPNLTIEVIMKKINLKQHFATTYMHLTKKTTVCIPEHLFGPLYYACTHSLLESL